MERAIYRWGQSKLFENAGHPMPPLFVKIVEKIKRDFGEDVNHAIAIYYHSGVEQHAPPHKDKAIGVKVKSGVPTDMAERGNSGNPSQTDPREPSRVSDFQGVFGAHVTAIVARMRAQPRLLYKKSLSFGRE